MAESSIGQEDRLSARSDGAAPDASHHHAARIWTAGAEVGCQLASILGLSGLLRMVCTAGSMDDPYRLVGSDRRESELPSRTLASTRQTG